MKIEIEGLVPKDIVKLTKNLEKVKVDSGKTAFKIIDTVCDKLMAEAIKRVPVDEGFLEKSFDKQVLKAQLASEVVGYVFVPPNSPASDYAMYMHELQYNLGEKSQEKENASLGIKVGRKYLERALTENDKAFASYIERKLREALK